MWFLFTNPIFFAYFVIILMLLCFLFIKTLLKITINCHIKMRNLTDINKWQKNFGLLPTHLNPTVSDSTYLMLNGSYGNFCLQIGDEQFSPEEYYSKSWSVNTKHFVHVNSDKVKVFDWAKKRPEEIKLEQVESNFDKFYNYLLTKVYRTENDVIPFIVNIFQQFRNITLEKADPAEALNLLFVLLISIEENYTKIDTEKWNISSYHIPNGFEGFSKQLRNGYNDNIPQLDLILRHIAGTLFQEAHKQVLHFNPQRDLFGGVSNELTFKSTSYTSVHYTPQYLARSIVENSIKLLDLSQEKISIFDPACGASEFLLEALKQLKEKGFAGKVEVVGWDTSSSAVQVSNFLLQYQKRTQWNNGNMSFCIKHVEDSLGEIWDNHDLILMNPPFVSWELLKDKALRDLLKDVLGDMGKGKPNLAAAFFLKAAESIKETGVLGCVLPSSILNFDNYKPLREAVGEMLTSRLLAKLGNFVFETALTDVSFYIGQKPKSNTLPKVIWCKNEKGNVSDVLKDLRKMQYNNQLNVDAGNYCIYHPSRFPLVAESWKIISLKENKLLNTIHRYLEAQQLVRLSEIFNVSLGIRMGDKHAFLLSYDEYHNISSDEKYLYRAAIRNDSIKNGQLYLKYYIWYPYNEHGLILETEDELQRKAPYSYDKLLQYRESLVTKSRRSESRWWHLSDPTAWLKTSQPRLYSTEFGKSDSFAFDEKGEYVVQSGHGWIPKKDFKTHDYYFYLALFSSNLFDSLLSIYSKQLAGGKWYSLGKKYTKNIPIPNVHDEKISTSKGYDQMIELGKEFSTGNRFVKPMIDEVLLKYFYPESS